MKRGRRGDCEAGSRGATNSLALSRLSIRLTGSFVSISERRDSIRHQYSLEVLWSEVPQEVFKCGKVLFSGWDRKAPNCVYLAYGRRDNVS